MTSPEFLSEPTEARPHGFRDVAEATQTILALKVLDEGLCIDTPREGPNALFDPYWDAVKEIEKTDPDYLSAIAGTFMQHEVPYVRQSGMAILDLFHRNKALKEGDTAFVSAEITRWQQALVDPDEECREQAADFIDGLADAFFPALEPSFAREQLAVQFWSLIRDPDDI